MPLGCTMFNQYDILGLVKLTEVAYNVSKSKFTYPSLVFLLVTLCPPQSLFSLLYECIHLIKLISISCDENKLLRNIMKNKEIESADCDKSIVLN